MDSLNYIFGLAALAYIVTSTMFAAVRWWHTCLILEHTSLAQYGMSHLAKGMVVPVIGSLVVAFSLLCMAKEFTCLKHRRQFISICLFGF